MKRNLIAILLIPALTLFFAWNFSKAEDVIICVSEENESGAVVAEQGQCIDDEEELTISGTDITKIQPISPIVISSENNNCEEGFSGIKTQIGFDQNDNGELDENELIKTIATCGPIP